MPPTEPSILVTTPPQTPTPRIVPFVVPANRIDQDAAKVVRRLVRYGHVAYLVGGCVRDLLLGKTPKDFDIATSARPAEVRTLFRNSRVVGRRFRLVHVLFAGGKVIEVATLRRDPSSLMEAPEDWEASEGTPTADTLDSSPSLNGRPGKRSREDDDLLIRHDNTFGEPHEDAARRDFTMNALFYDLERQEIVDYVGGLGEIDRRVLRTIGEPDVRFREDPVRILRAIKFAARLDLGLEPDVYDAMIAHRDELLRAARPRLLEELLRLLRGGAARASFWLAYESGVLSVLLPELSSYIDDDVEFTTRLWRRLSELDEWFIRGELPSDAVLLAALLLEPIEESMEGERDLVGAVADFLQPLVERLALTRRMSERLRQILPVQRRLREGRVGSLARRDFFPEAAALFALDATARGLDHEEIDRLLSGHQDNSQRRRRDNDAR